MSNLKDATSLTPRDVYSRRFADTQSFRITMWRILCRDFFQKYIPPGACVLEVAAGHCEFINAIQAGRRIATDINTDLPRYADNGVETEILAATELAKLGEHMVDAIFVSNFFEHITKPDIIRCLQGAWRVLKPGGRLLILQPNIRYCMRDYWMFFDHVTPLDDRALTEALELCGYRVEVNIPRFLPYTTQRSLPLVPWLVRLYLRLPWVWRLFGAQAFIMAVRPPAEDDGDDRP